MGEMGIGRNDSLSPSSPEDPIAAEPMDSAPGSRRALDMS